MENTDIYGENHHLKVENMRLKSDNEKLKLSKETDSKLLTLHGVVKRTLERKVVASAENENWFANEYYKSIDKYIVEEKEKEATELTAQIRVLRFMLAEVERPL